MTVKRPGRSLLQAIRSASLSVVSATLLAAAVMAAVAAAPAAASASIPVVTATDVSMGTGACQNGNSHGGTTDVVNCNLFPNKASVWLAATGNPSAIPAGTYFFVVLAPSGQNNVADSSSNTANLSYAAGDPYTNREFTIDANGTMSYPGTHSFDASENKIQLFPYNDTPNQGGEYVLGLCALASGQTPSDVSPSSCKFDNFKVAPGAPAPVPQLSALKSSSPASGSQVTPGQTVTYTVALTNTGNVPVSAGTVMPDQLTVLDA